MAHCPYRIHLRRPCLVLRLCPHLCPDRHPCRRRCHFPYRILCRYRSRSSGGGCLRNRHGILRRDGGIACRHGDSLLHCLNPLCDLLRLQRLREETFGTAAALMPAALTEIRCLQIDLIDLLLLLCDDGSKSDGEQEKDDDVNGGRDDICFSP